MSTRPSTPPAYFADMYRRDIDPWRMASSDYERDKYAATIALLPPRRFRSALEIGCSIGELTRRLASHANRVLGVDLDDQPLSRARETCADQPHVSFAKLVVPGAWPDGSFDLIVLSEVLYFLNQQDIEATARRVSACAGPDANIVLVNWLGSTEAPCEGDAAADLFIAAIRASFMTVKQDRTPQYRMDLLAPTRAREPDQVVSRSSSGR